MIENAIERTGIAFPQNRISPFIARYSLDRPKALVGFLAYFAGYAALLVWFKWVDVYHLQFAQRGIIVLVHNAFRLLFIFYLFWIIEAVGAFALRLLVGGNFNVLRSGERLVLSFFAGTGIWHVAMLILGYLNLYTVPVMLVLSVPIVAASYLEVLLALRQRRLLAWLHRDQWAGARGWQPILAGLALICGVLLLLTKGLYPSGSHDYFLHYFEYYRSVLAHHGIWPNEVWYHYYYSKGAGLFFLAMLLTDPLAPQLVTFCFMVVASAAVYFFIERFSRGSLWPWVGVITFITVYVYTPGHGAYFGNGGWGDFEKLHEVNTAFVIAILWATAGALDASPPLRRAWSFSAGSAIAAAIIVNSTISVFLGGIMGVLMVWYLAHRDWPRTILCFSLAATSGVTLIAILLINYVTTGLANDQGILTFWRFADVEKLYHWGALAQILDLHRDRTKIVASSLSLSGVTQFLFDVLRINLLKALVASGIVAGAVIVGVRFWSRPPPRAVAQRTGHVAVLVVALAAIVVFTVAVGLEQYISFYRYSSFAVPVVIVAATAACAAAWHHFRWPDNIAWHGIAPFLLVAIQLVRLMLLFGGQSLVVIRDGWRFAHGGMSIDTAYATRGTRPGHVWGGTYPGVRGAVAVAGPNTPIWTFHISSYCMLPNCHMASDRSFILSRDWDRVIFGTPEEARDALQKAGYDYFLFSKELGVNDRLTFSSLFARSNVNRFIGIRWTDGVTALLTWAGPDTQPLDQSWLDALQKAGDQSASPAPLQPAWQKLRQMPHPWHSFPLEWQ